MAYASKAGRARISASNPQAQAVCDRCGIWTNHYRLAWQFDYRGAVLMNIRILVCNRCYDKPQEQLRAIVLPADPVPIVQPRVESFLADETNYQAVSGPPAIDPATGIPVPGNTTLQTEDGQDLLTQPVGPPLGRDQNAVMPLEGTTHYRVQLNPLSISSIGTDQITVTFSSPHGLSTNDQIVVQGLSNKAACGAYSITVTTATAFTYQTNTVIAPSSLLTGSTLMVTANIGLPLGFVQLPQTGI